MTTPWPPADEVHLYRLILPHDPAELTRLTAFLVADETARADALKSQAAQRRFRAGRGLLRDILAGYLGLDPRDVPLATGAHGKPGLSGAGAELRFNLAHSGDRLLLAIATGREVGVDIEQIGSDRPLEAMARLVFSPGEQAELAGLSPSAREQAFCRGWVRKEACLKGCGRGFSLPGNCVEVSPLDEAVASLLVNCDEQYWQVADLMVPAPYCAALAMAPGKFSGHPALVVRDTYPAVSQKAFEEGNLP